MTNDNQTPQVPQTPSGAGNVNPDGGNAPSFPPQAPLPTQLAFTNGYRPSSAAPDSAPMPEYSSVSNQAPTPNQAPGYAPAPGYASGLGYAPDQASVPKSRVAAGVMGILFGSLGVHNFYLGHYGKAAAQLAITLLGSFILIGPFISGAWGLIEGVLILATKDPNSSFSKDAKGNPLV